MNAATRPTPRRRSLSGPVAALALAGVARRRACSLRSPFGIAVQGRTRRGSILILVITIAAVLGLSLSYLVLHMTDARKLQASRQEQDMTFYVASAGLQQAAAWLAAQDPNVLPGPGNVAQSPLYDGLTATTSADLDDGNRAYYTLNTVRSIAAGYDLTVWIIPQRPGSTFSSAIYWTVVSTARSTGAGYSGRAVARRVQATFSQESFGQFEQLINQQPLTMGSQLVAWGLNQSFLGPIHTNSGVGMFPNLWFADTFSTSVSGAPPVREYTDFNSYRNGVRQADANNYVNILDTYASYRTPPQFMGGFEQRPTIDLPEVNNPDNSSVSRLYTQAGLRLPDDFATFAASSAYASLVTPTSLSDAPDFVIELKAGSSTGDGVVEIRQWAYEYDASGNKVTDASGNFVRQLIPPAGQPAMSVDYSDINNALLVKGNIVSLSGTVDGALSVGAVKPPVTDPYYSPNATGQIDITGSVQYRSKTDPTAFETNTGVATSDTDDSKFLAPDGTSVNQLYLDRLRSNTEALTDILGLVTDNNITVKQYHPLTGAEIAADPSDPLYIDGVIMATGRANSGDPNSGQLAVENYSTRKKGKLVHVGGSITNVPTIFGSRSRTGALANGLEYNRCYDFRVSDTGGRLPPWFPITGGFGIVQYSWRENFVPEDDWTNLDSTNLWLPIKDGVNRMNGRSTGS